MHRGISSPDRQSLQSSQRTSAVYGPFDDPEWGCYSGGLPTETNWKGTWTLPTPEEEATLLGKEDEPSEVPGPIPIHSEIPRFLEPVKWTTTPVTSAVPCLTSKPCSCPPRKERSYWKGFTLTPITPASESKPTWRQITGSWSGERSFIPLSTLQMGIVMMPKSKVWLASKLQPFACQPPRRKYKVPGLPNPAWQC